MDLLLLPPNYDRILRFVIPASEKCVLLCTRVVLELGQLPAAVVFDWPIELLQATQTLFARVVSHLLHYRLAHWR